MHRVFQRWRERDNPLFAALHAVPLFRDLSFRELREVVQTLQIRRYAPGEIAFEQGAPGQGVFIVLSGGVDISQTDDSDGEQVVLAHAEQGAFFGETALLDDTPRTASAVVSDDSELALFPRSALLLLAEQHPNLGVKIALQLSQIIAERLRRTNRALRTARDDVDAEKHAQGEGAP